MVKMTDEMQKFVHLDLKGAPPKMSYLLSLLPFFKAWGATGLLIEYEDTFPYEGNLAILASSSFAYSKEELNLLLEACQSQGLDVIPLIQTFGHFEFVLKHEKFADLREKNDMPNCVCPRKLESVKLIFEIIDQILNFHKNISRIHIGCDEVWNLGLCDGCSSYLELGSIDSSKDCQILSREKLFLQHVSSIVAYIKRSNPNLNVIIWDDMLRKIDEAVLKDFNRAADCEVMVWYYGEADFPGRLLSKYCDIFKRVWAASAFKGASGCAKVVPDLSLHVSNHKLWLAVIKDEQEQNKHVSICGFVLTGWSRYDHYAVLCEMLPSGLPSLAICLQILKRGSFDETTHDEASKLLGLHEKMPLVSGKEANFDCLTFPGKELYELISMNNKLLTRFNDFINSHLYTGWFNRYNIDRNFFNPGVIDQLKKAATNIFDDFCTLKSNLRSEMATIYPECVTDEWLGQHVNTYCKKLEKIIAKFDTCF